MQIVITLDVYGVKNIVGIPFGYRGFFDKTLSEIPVSNNLLTQLKCHSLEATNLTYSLETSFIFQLSREVVQNINLAGGSLLGVSRGSASTGEIVDSIQVFPNCRDKGVKQCLLFSLPYLIRLLSCYMLNVPFRPEELIWFSYLVEMVLMQERMQYTRRYLILFLLMVFRQNNHMIPKLYKCFSFMLLVIRPYYILEVFVVNGFFFSCSQLHYYDARYLRQAGFICILVCTL